MADKLKCIYDGLCNYYTPIDVLKDISKYTEHNMHSVYLNSQILIAAKEHNFDKSLINLIAKTMCFGHFARPDNERNTDFITLVNFFTEMEDKYSLNSYAFDKIHSVKKDMYKHIINNLMDMTRAEILYKIIKSPEHKFEMYLEVEECYKELNLQEVKAENLIKEIISKFEENTHEKKLEEISER